tara:strand:+ start:89 stop:1048 length:960 start_codon:yes stop_codon:yes gene_type:complete
MKRKKSMVIDLTYICNFTCNYCQWGDPKNEKRKNIELEKLLFEPKSLKRMDIKRVVFSGGEPLLHPDFKKIVDYYAKLVKEVVTITNGLLISKTWIEDYAKIGGTGLTFSLDSMDEKISLETRDLSTENLLKVVENIKKASSAKNTGLIDEIGLNVVISNANCNLNDIKNTMEFAKNIGLDFVKFQPIFDDGYVSKNSSELKLTKRNASEMRIIGKWVESNYTITTNTPDFWYTLAQLNEGKTLSGRTCGIDNYQSILMNGLTKFCYWVDDPVYGTFNNVLTEKSVKDSVSQFKIKKNKCETGNHCFCLQDMQHTWEVT